MSVAILYVRLNPSPAGTQPTPPTPPEMFGLGLCISERTFRRFGGARELVKLMRESAEHGRTTHFVAIKRSGKPCRRWVGVMNSKYQILKPTGTGGGKLPRRPRGGVRAQIQCGLRDVNQTSPPSPLAEAERGSKTGTSPGA